MERITESQLWTIDDNATGGVHWSEKAEQNEWHEEAHEDDMNVALCYLSLSDEKR